MFDTSATLGRDVMATGSVTINSGVTVTTNGNNFYSDGAFVSSGTINTGGTPQQNFPNSYGGSGGGGQSGCCGGGYAGYSTQYPGGGAGGGGTGGAGGTPIAPSMSTGLIQSWYSGGMSNYLAGAHGGNGETYCCSGGTGAYGVFIEAYSISAGTINAAGGNGSGTCSGTALGGGGGGGVIVFAYGSGGLVSAGSISNSGGIGAPSCGGPNPNEGAIGGPGSPGSGSYLQFSYGATPPITP